MAHVEIVDQTLRDGPQSLWGMRIRGGMATSAAPLLDRAGYHTADVPSGSCSSKGQGKCVHLPYEHSLCSPL